MVLACQNKKLRLTVDQNKITGNSGSAKRSRIYALPYTEMTKFVHPTEIITHGFLLKKLGPHMSWSIDLEPYAATNAGILLIGDIDNCITDPYNVVFKSDADCSMPLVYKFDHTSDLLFLHIYLPTNKPTTLYSSFVTDTSAIFSTKNIVTEGIVSGYVLLIKELGVNEHIYFAAESECKSTVYKENIDQTNHESEGAEKAANVKEISSKVFIPQTVEVKPVNKQMNPGGVMATKDSRSCNLWDLIVKIREVENRNGIVYIPVLVAGGPADFYYLVREQDDRRGDPSVMNIIHYGTALGSLDDEKITIAINNYIPTVRNIVYIVALKGECEYGPYKRRFFP